MSFIAFIPAVAKAPVPHVETKPAVPTFKRRWWHDKRKLDARPVIWSLRNRPAEWDVSSNLSVKHLPSEHSFWTAWPMNGLLSAHDCSCGSDGRGHFQRFQNFWFKRAVARCRRWHRRNEPDTSEQFAAHFIRGA